ncbi:MAG: cell division protein FtsA [Hyphomicrobiaceae bacterium]|nr:cell division protein FtsA [Hyphomicrobiaceae bacterium]
MSSLRKTGGKGPIGVLDIGTAKVCAAITAADSDGVPMLLGLGHQKARGIKSGMVIDPDEAERAVRAAVGQAERMAGVSLDRVVVSISAGRMRSTSFVARATLESGVVRESDIDRILADGEAWLDRSGRAVIQLGRSGWRLDEATGIADPCGLAGRELAVDLSAVTADEGTVRNLVGVVERSHMLAERLVPAPYASGVAVATEEERRAGVLVVEMGAGVTSVAIFAEGRVVHVDAVPVGGNHLTYDIARELVTTIAEAERIKTLYGTLIKASSDDAEMIAYPVAGGDEPGGLHQTSKAHVREILAPRIEGLLGQVAERIDESGLGAMATRRVVITGGASQLLGLDQVWSRRFPGSVRIGRPQPVGRMPGSMCSPAFSTVIGLLQVAGMPPDVQRASGGVGSRDRGYLDRIERWIRESF